MINDVVVHTYKDGATISLYADSRGESATYTRYSFVCRGPTGREYGRGEGLRHDWPDSLQECLLPGVLAAIDVLRHT